jgi:[ribosomal protein S18]-alanine N-acetyltransferase
VTGRAEGRGTPKREIRIRPARAADLPRVREVEVECFSVPWGEGSFRSLLGLTRVFFLVAEVDREVMGHGVLWWTADEGELANLAVHPAVRGTGVAGALLDALLRRGGDAGLERIFLEVRRSNEVALHLYRSRGFREVGVRRDYYRRPVEDARVLRVDLDPVPASRGFRFPFASRGRSTQPRHDNRNP